MLATRSVNLESSINHGPIVPHGPQRIMPLSKGVYAVHYPYSLGKITTYI